MVKTWRRDKPSDHTYTSAEKLMALKYRPPRKKLMQNTRGRMLDLDGNSINCLILLKKTIHYYIYSKTSVFMQANHKIG